MAMQQPFPGASHSFLVAVTGGGLYDSGFDYNSAAVLKDALPDSFSRPGRSDIKILKVRENLPSEYRPSVELIHGMWEGHASLYNEAATESDERVDVQLMIHMGMRTAEPSYCFETVARRDGYVHPDVCGELPDPADYGSDGRLGGCPSELRPALDIDAAEKKTRSKLLDPKMRVSENAGHNLCEWFFYNSLAEGYKRGLPLHVAFIHVPPGRTTEELRAGVQIVRGYIEALAEQIDDEKDTHRL